MRTRKRDLVAFTVGATIGAYFVPWVLKKLGL
jgi:hypothetical protein